MSPCRSPSTADFGRECGETADKLATRIVPRRGHPDKLTIRCYEDVSLPEFVVAAAEDLHECVTVDDDAGGPVGLQAEHRAQPGLPSVVAPARLFASHPSTPRPGSNRSIRHVPSTHSRSRTVASLGA